MSVTDIKTPSVTTLTIEVKVIKIGKKQCTISVFDQLPFQHICINKNNIWESICVWGQVKRREDWVLVYDLEGRLYKSKMPNKIFTPNSFLEYLWFQNFHFTSLLEEIGAEFLFFTRADWGAFDRSEPYVHFVEDYKWSRGTEPTERDGRLSHIYRFALEKEKIGLPFDKDGRPTASPDLWPETIKRRCDLSKIYKDFEKYKATSEKYNAFCDKCSKSDQLFIAV